MGIWTRLWDVWTRAAALLSYVCGSRDNNATCPTEARKHIRNHTSNVYLYFFLYNLHSESSVLCKTELFLLKRENSGLFLLVWEHSCALIQQGSRLVESCYPPVGILYTHTHTHTFPRGGCA